MRTILFGTLLGVYGLSIADCAIEPTRLVEFEISECRSIEKDLRGNDLTKWRAGLMLKVSVKAEYVLAPGYADEPIDASLVDHLDVAQTRTYFFRTNNPLLCSVRFTSGSRHVMHQTNPCCDTFPPAEPICAATNGFYIEELPPL